MSRELLKTVTVLALKKRTNFILQNNPTHFKTLHCVTATIETMNV